MKGEQAAVSISPGVVDERPEPRAPAWARRSVAALMLVGLVAFAFWLVRNHSAQWFLGMGVTTGVLVGLGLLSVRYPWVANALTRIFAAYLVFFLWLLAAIAPLVVFRWIFSSLTWRLPLWAQIPAFAALAALLAGAVWLIGTKPRRERLFSRLRGAGGFMPLIYVANVLMIAAMFFASLTFILVRHDVVRLAITAGDDVVFGKLLDFYVWHFFDLVPLVKVNETLHWQEPLTYDSGWLGFLLLVFKAAVIVPAIGAFAGYFEQRNSTNAASGQAGAAASGQAEAAASS